MFPLCQDFAVVWGVFWPHDVWTSESKKPSRVERKLPKASLLYCLACLVGASRIGRKSLPCHTMSMSNLPQGRLDLWIGAKNQPRRPRASLINWVLICFFPKHWSQWVMEKLQASRVFSAYWTKLLIKVARHKVRLQSENYVTALGNNSGPPGQLQCFCWSQRSTKEFRFNLHLLARDPILHYSPGSPLFEAGALLKYL